MLVSDRVRVAGVPFQAAPLLQATDRFVAACTTTEAAGPMRFVNAYSLSCASDQPAYWRVLTGPGVNFADGRPLALILTWLSRRELVPQVPGPEFFESCLDRGRQHGLRHYLLGGTPDLLEQLIDAVARRFPGAEVAGTHSPPFRPLSPEEQSAQDDQIRHSGADIVWVGLGTPKQDFEAQRLNETLGLPPREWELPSTSRRVQEAGASLGGLPGAGMGAPAHHGAAPPLAQVPVRQHQVSDLGRQGGMSRRAHRRRP